GSALTLQAVSAAPTGLAVAAADSALAVAPAVTGFTVSLYKIMKTTYFKLGFTTVMAAAAAAAWLVHYRSQAARPAQDLPSRGQIAQLEFVRLEPKAKVPAEALPAARQPATAVASTDVGIMPSEPDSATNFFGLITQKKGTLTVGQLESYLNA